MFLSAPFKYSLVGAVRRCYCCLSPSSVTWCNSNDPGVRPFVARYVMCLFIFRARLISSSSFPFHSLSPSYAAPRWREIDATKFGSKFRIYSRNGAVGSRPTSLYSLTLKLFDIVKIFSFFGGLLALNSDHPRKSEWIFTKRFVIFLSFTRISTFYRTLFAAVARSIQQRVHWPMLECIKWSWDEQRN